MKRLIAIDFSTTNTALFYRDGDSTEGQYLPFGGETYVPTLILSQGTQNIGTMTLTNSQALYGWAAAKDYKFPSLLKQNFKTDLCSQDPVLRQEAQALTRDFFRYLHRAYTDNCIFPKGSEITETSTLVTFPAKFSEEAKAVLKAAAEEAGFPGVSLLSEAEAAMQYALHFDTGSTKAFFTAQKGRTVRIMLIDMGGGTTDIAVFTCPADDPTAHQLLACWPSEGGIAFGGSQVDRLLCQYYQDHLPPDFGKKFLRESRMKDYKELLSEDLAKADQTVPPQQEIASSYYMLFGQELELEINRKVLEQQILKDYLPQFPALIQGALEAAKLRANQIDLVLLTGGHSQWYFVPRLLKQTLPKARILSFPQPHLVVAKGAVYTPEQRPLKLKRIQKDGKYGFADSYGNVVVPCQYLYASEFSEGYAWVVSDSNKVGILRDTGEVAVPCQWEDLRSCGQRDDRIYVCLHGKWGLVSWSGKILQPYQWDAVDPPQGGRNFVKKGGKWALADEDGKCLTSFRFDDFNSFKKGIAPVRENGNRKYLAADGTVYDDLSPEEEGFRVVRKDGKIGFVNQAGICVIPPRYTDAENFSEGLAAVEVDKWFWGFIDRKGNMVIQPGWFHVRSFHEGYALVYDDYKWGVIDRTGKEVIPLEWDRIGDFHNGRARACKTETVHYWSYSTWYGHSESRNEEICGHLYPDGRFVQGPWTTWSDIPL